MSDFDNTFDVITAGAGPAGCVLASRLSEESGKLQKKPYINREPKAWNHDLFRGDGTPYRKLEVELIKAYSVAPRGIVPK